MEAVLAVGGEGGHDAGIDEDADGDRHFAAMDEVIHDDGGTETAGFTDPATAVLDDENGRRLAGLVLRGHVDPVVAGGAGVHLAGEGVFGDLTDGSAGVALMIGA